MEACYDRQAATKRDLDEATNQPLPFGELGMDAEEEAAEALLGAGTEMPAVKKAKAHKDAASKLSASEVATKLVLQMAAKFPTGPQNETSSADMAVAGQAESSSG